MGEHFLHESQTLAHLVTSLGDVAVTEKLKYITSALPSFSLSLKNRQVPHQGETGLIDLKDGAGCLWERDWGTDGSEVMSAHVSAGEVFSAMGGWAGCPISFHLSCQSGLMTLGGAYVLVGMGGGSDVRCCFSAAVSLSRPKCAHREHGTHDMTYQHSLWRSLSGCGSESREAIWCSTKDHMSVTGWIHREGLYVLKVSSLVSVRLAMRIFGLSYPGFLHRNQWRSDFNKALKWQRHSLQFKSFIENLCSSVNDQERPSVVHVRYRHSLTRGSCRALVWHSSIPSRPVRGTEDMENAQVLWFAVFIRVNTLSLRAGSQWVLHILKGQYHTNISSLLGLCVTLFSNAHMCIFSLCWPLWPGVNVVNVRV